LKLLVQLKKEDINQERSFSFEFLPFSIPILGLKGLSKLKIGLLTGRAE